MYVNQAELLLTYPMSDNINLGILFNYSKSLIEKSDTFPITIDHITRGSFYQPQRAMYSKRVGIQLNLYF